jgi:hypothetical protein
VNERLVPVLVLSAVFSLGAAAEGRFDLSGCSETLLSADACDGSLGAAQAFRLEGDFRPEESLHLHLELQWQGLYGSANPLTVLAREGLVPPLPDPAAFPFRDFHHALSVEQAWGSLLLGPLDLQAGLQHLGWGTGYFFNPTDRTGPFDTAPLDLEDPSAVMAVAAALHLPHDIALSAYLALQERTRSGQPLPEEGELGNLPFGVKLQWRSPLIDLSASFLREVLAGTPWEARTYAGCDASTFAGPLELYAEGVCLLPLGRTAGSGLSMKEDLELCAGGNVLLPGPEVTVRAEYAHIGSGSTSRSAYDWPGLIGGRRATLGEDYLILALERETGMTWELRGGGLWNLNDGSLALAAEAVWLPTAGSELALWAFCPWGRRGSEMNGEFAVAPDVTADLLRPEVGLRVNLYF